MTGRAVTLRLAGLVALAVAAACRPSPEARGCGPRELSGAHSACAGRTLPAETATLTAAAVAFFEAHGRGTPYPSGPYDMNLYPTEGLAPLWSGAEATGTAAPRALAVAHVEHALSVTPDGVFRWPDGSAPPRVGSNTQARFALAYWLAYRATGDLRYLRAAEASHAALAAAPEVEVVSSATGARFQLPAYVYRLVDGALVVDSGRTLDPNQDATLSLLAALLHATPASVHHGAPGLAAERDRHLSALLEMLRPDRCVPAADQPAHLGRCDSLYGWWTLFQASVLDRLVTSPELHAAVERQYGLYRVYTLERTSVRSYPAVELTRLTRLDELLFALGTASALERWEDVRAMDSTFQALVRERAAQPSTEPFRFVGFDTSTLDLLERFLAGMPPG